MGGNLVPLTERHRHSLICPDCFSFDSGARPFMAIGL